MLRACSATAVTLILRSIWYWHAIGMLLRLPCTLCFGIIFPAVLLFHIFSGDKERSNREDRAVAATTAGGGQ